MPSILSRKNKDNTIQVGKPSPPWMLTYSDLMTQILIFFVMMFALASAMNEMQLLKLKKRISHYVKEKHLEEVIGLTINEKGLIISLREKIMFNSGEAVIFPSAKKMLSEISTFVIPAPNEIAVEGHTDNVPISKRLKSKYATNWELSTARATNVARYLIEGMKVEHKQILKDAGFRTISDLIHLTIPELMRKTNLSKVHAFYLLSIVKTIALEAGAIKKFDSDDGTERIRYWQRFLELKDEKDYEHLNLILKMPVNIIRPFAFDPKRISSAGYGKYHPIAGTVAKQTEKQRNLNRRVDIVVKRIGSSLKRKKGVKKIL